MKRILRALFVAAIALCLMQAFALAADRVSVQLDGNAVRFTDAEPRIVDNRTFIPARAVLEQMGAEVSYDRGVVTAVRGGRTIAMTIGSPTFRVTENGETAELTMDVAPFIDPALGRTFIPVRFAAEALGANVGWDAAKRTVVIVDAEKQADALLAGKSFEYLDKFFAYSQKYNTGLWDGEVACSGNFDMDLSSVDPMMPKLSIPMSVTAKATTRDGMKMDLTETVTMDLSSVKPLLSMFVPSGVDADTDAEMEQALNEIIRALNRKGVSLSVRGDLSAGKLYMNIDASALGEDLAGELGLGKDTWLAFDFADLGVDFAALLEQSQSIDCRTLLSDVLSGVLSIADVNDVNACAELSAALQPMVDAFADSGFTRDGNAYTTAFTFAADGLALEFDLSLTIRNDAVVAYDVRVALEGAAPEVGAVSMTVKIGVNQRDELAGSIRMNFADMAGAAFDITGGYTRGRTEPVTVPPAGAEVVDFRDLVGSMDELPDL